MIVAGKVLFIIKYAKFDRLCITTFIISFNYKKKNPSFLQSKVDGFVKENITVFSFDMVVIPTVAECSIRVVSWF
jgi:hypothetical protein